MLFKRAMVVASGFTIMINEIDIELVQLKQRVYHKFVPGEQPKARMVGHV
jgi:hypothetical protein